MKNYKLAIRALLVVLSASLSWAGTGAPASEPAAVQLLHSGSAMLVYNTAPAAPASLVEPDTVASAEKKAVQNPASN